MFDTCTIVTYFYYLKSREIKCIIKQNLDFVLLKYNEFDPSSEWTLLTQVRYASLKARNIIKCFGVRVKNVFELYPVVRNEFLINNIKKIRRYRISKYRIK